MIQVSILWIVIDVFELKYTKLTVTQLVFSKIMYYLDMAR